MKDDETYLTLAEAAIQRGHWNRCLDHLTDLLDRAKLTVEMHTKALNVADKMNRSIPDLMEKAGELVTIVGGETRLPILKQRSVHSYKDILSALLKPETYDRAVLLIEQAVASPNEEFIAKTTDVLTRNLRPLPDEDKELFENAARTRYGDSAAAAGHSETAREIHEKLVHPAFVVITKALMSAQKPAPENPPGPAAG